eukprot:TRINITY_DN7516_c0_g1_i2.p1 TRINITY_DN7516_c0_g1~~TRINITY_DN7516_c0_g1_i2.p1  ORF type:complete len:145 (-),score=21.29 TRINITY_DN7516_c0_g1_i2:54-488(-)
MCIRDRGASFGRTVTDGCGGGGCCCCCLVFRPVGVVVVPSNTPFSRAEIDTHTFFFSPLADATRGTATAVVNGLRALLLLLLLAYVVTSSSLSPGVDDVGGKPSTRVHTVSYTHLRAHETPEHLVCRLLLEKKKIQVYNILLHL